MTSVYYFVVPVVVGLIAGTANVLCADSTLSDAKQPVAADNYWQKSPNASATNLDAQWPQLGGRGGRRDFVSSPRTPVSSTSTTPRGPNLAPGRTTKATRDFISSPRPAVQHNNEWPELGGRRNAPSSTTPRAILTPKARRDFVSSPRPQGPKQHHNEWPELGATRTPSRPGNNAVRDFVSPGVQLPTSTRKYSSFLTSTPSTNTGVVKPAAGPQTFAGNRAVAGNVRPASGPQAPKGNSETSRSQEDEELREFSEALLRKETNNALKYVTINYQGKTRSGSPADEAPKPLLAIHNDAYNIPSIAKLIPLHNNYILESKNNEVYTAQEKLEENDFLDTILPTAVMQHTRNYLIQKGKVSKDPKDFKSLLKTIWFNMYSRGGGRIGSSGFEHVFVAEIKNNAISGLHNWLYFSDEEKKNLLNYLGYMKKLEFGKGAILKYHFTFHDIDKPVGSMFIGTSPEFEFALYTTCFLMRQDDVCPLRLDGQNFIVRTYAYRYRGKNMIGSAFPEI